ncbi:AraC family transcriptional regulator [Nonomuraea rosea]
MAAADADATGFADQSHLIRRFSRYFGTTPGSFRRAIHCTRAIR